MSVCKALLHHTVLSFNDDIMMTKLAISEKCAFDLQVVNLWLPSHDHEFTSWMEHNISKVGYSVLSARDGHSGYTVYHQHIQTYIRTSFSLSHPLAWRPELARIMTGQMLECLVQCSMSSHHLRTYVRIHTATTHTQLTALIHCTYIIVCRLIACPVYLNKSARCL